MIVSLFSLIVARGAEVPVADLRLAAHIGYASRVDTTDQGPATQADSISVTDALDARPVSTPNGDSSDAVAPSREE
jgi:hypothetical protein